MLPDSSLGQNYRNTFGKCTLMFTSLFLNILPFTVFTCYMKISNDPGLLAKNKFSHWLIAVVLPSYHNF